MSRYYTGRQVWHYNTRWRTFTTITLAETLAMIDIDALRSVPERLGGLPCLLDVACGTGILLKQLLVQVPDAEAYGVDASADMLAQARVALKDQPYAHLERVEISTGESESLAYRQETFDLITCTNALYDMPEPVATLAELSRLLALAGQLVVEDFTRREPPFPWAVLEWLLQRIERNSVHACTLTEAQSLCEQVGLHVVCGRVFSVDWL